MEWAATLDSVRRGLDQAALGFQTLPFWVLVVGHSLTAVDAMRGFADCWLVSWLIGFLAAYGGGSLSALLLQDPAVAAVGILAKNQLGLVYTLVWWAFNYAPGRWTVRAYDALPPLRMTSRLARAVLRGTTVVHRVDAAVKLHPGVVAAPILLATLGGCGGTLLVDAYTRCAGYRQGPTELSHPGYPLRSAAAGALLQYLLVHVTGLLSSQQGLGLVLSLYTAHSLAQDLTGSPCDYTSPLGWLFHKLTNIPEPPMPSAAAAATTDAKPRRSSRGRAAAAAVGSPVRAAGERPDPESDGAENGKLQPKARALQAGGETPAVRRTTRRRAMAAAATMQE